MPVLCVLFIVQLLLTVLNLGTIVKAKKSFKSSARIKIDMLFFPFSF